MDDERRIYYAHTGLGRSALETELARLCGCQLQVGRRQAVALGAFVRKRTVMPSCLTSSRGECSSIPSMPPMASMSLTAAWSDAVR